jgi:LuxR family maltose regulon positive regulatory protein
LTPATRRTLVSTKLYAPRLRGSLVARPRLIDLLDGDSGRRLTIVCAPAGYGKSTLVAQWLARAAVPAAWVSFDAGDNDPWSFFALVVAALRSLDQDLAADTLAQLDEPGVPDFRPLVATLLEEVSTTTRSFALVLDDYHVIDAPEIHQGLSFLLQRLPPTMRVVLISRTEPPLPLARLRANGDVFEVGRQDLQFSDDEARELYQGSLALDLAPGEVDALNARTEGWVIALQLVGLSLRGQPRERVRRFSQEPAGSARFVDAYLWEEILQRRPEELRAFLLRAAILDRFSAELCEAVTGIAGAAELIRRCERDNLFVIPLDDRGGWYRFHQLFADALRDRLAQEAGDDAIGELHRRAARWLEDRGLLMEAVHHATAGRDWDRAVKLLDEVCADLFKQDQLVRLRAWLEGLPAEILERSPRPAFWLAWALGRAGHFAEALPPLRIAERAWTAADDRPGLGLVLLWHALRCLITFDSVRAIDYAHRALDLLPEDRTVERAMVWLLLGIAHLYRGELNEAEPAYATVRMTADGAGQPWIRQAEMVGSAVGLIQRGTLLEATVLCRRVLRLSDDPPLGIWVQHALLQLGEVHLEWNLLDEADRNLQRADDLAELTRAVRWRSRVRRGLAQVAWARGESEVALNEVERAIEYAGQLRSHQEVRAARALQARFWLASGQLTLARRWAESCELDPYLPPEYERQGEHLTYVRLLIQDGRPDLALRILDAIQRQAEAAGRTGELVELHVLRALAHKAGGDHSSASFVLDRAFALGEPGGYLRVFVDEGEALAPLLRHAAARGAHRDYAQRLLTALDGTTSLPRPDQAESPDALSERELEVLRLVAAGLPNRDVGQRLFISEKTVKKHLSNILGKLGAANRTQAVDQARRLGVL